MLEMLSKNVFGSQSIENTKKILSHICEEDERAFEATAITTYLTKNKSALSTDIMFKYFSPTSYSEVRSILSSAKSLLNEQGVLFSSYPDNQDYFTLRSVLFQHNAALILTKEYPFKQKYRKILSKFIYKVPASFIDEYYVFKRTAYDAAFFYDVFNADPEADLLYEYLYDRINQDGDPYILQQRAFVCDNLKLTHLGPQ